MVVEYSIIYLWSHSTVTLSLPVSLVAAAMAVERTARTDGVPSYGQELWPESLLVRNCLPSISHTSSSCASILISTKRVQSRNYPAIRPYECRMRPPSSAMVWNWRARFLLWPFFTACCLSLSVRRSIPRTILPVNWKNQSRASHCSKTAETYLSACLLMKVSDLFPETNWQRFIQNLPNVSQNISLICRGFL